MKNPLSLTLLQLPLNTKHWHWGKCFQIAKYGKMYFCGASSTPWEGYYYRNNYVLD